MYWLSEADNAYEAIYNFYGGRNLPTGENDVFFGFTGCTKVVLLVTINAMRENWGLGWYTDDNVQRAAGFADIAADVWRMNNFACDYNGIVKFENWVFVACKDLPNLLEYMAGGSYGDLTNIANAFVEKTGAVFNKAVDVVKNVLTIPGESVTLAQKLTRWATIAGVVYVVKDIFKTKKER